MAPPVPSDRQKQEWEEDGWCLIEGAIPASELRDGQDALKRLFPTAAEMAAGTDAERNERWRTWDAAWPEFPFHSARLNRLVVHDVLIDLAQELLGGNEVRLYMGIATAKYGGQSSRYNQLLHTDYPNHSLVVPRRDAGYQQLEMFVYLSDVSAVNGATKIVSRRHTADIPVGQHTLNLADYAVLYDDPNDASGPAGSVLAYRPDVYHRSMDFTDPGASRFMLHVSYKPAQTEWLGYQAWQRSGFSPEWHNFVQAAGPRQLEVVGFPAPGHGYWTPETLAGVAERYPGLDLGPWLESAAVPGTSV